MNAAILFIVVWNLCSELVAINILRYEDGISGQITSPGYPGNYPNNVNYTWILRTGSHSANVTFRIIEMSIKEWGPCDDYLEITEIEPSCFILFKRCDHLKNYNLPGRGKKIRVSFISDESMTEKGFHLTWKVTLPPTTTTTKQSFISDKSMTEKGFHLTWNVTLPPTKALPMQKILATTKKYMVRTSQKVGVKTTAFQQKTTTPSSQEAKSMVQAKVSSTPKTTESTMEDISMLKKISSTTFTTLIPEFPSTAENSGRTTSPLTTSSSEQTSSLSKQYSDTKRPTLEKRSRPLTLSSTTRSSSVELTTLVFNATTEKENKNTIDIQTGHRVGSGLSTVNLFQSYHSNCFSAIWY